MSCRKQAQAARPVEDRAGEVGLYVVELAAQLGKLAATGTSNCGDHVHRVSNRCYLQTTCVSERRRRIKHNDHVAFLGRRDQHLQRRT